MPRTIIGPDDPLEKIILAHAYADLICRDGDTVGVLRDVACAMVAMVVDRAKAAGDRPATPAALALWNDIMAHGAVVIERLLADHDQRLN